MPQENKNLIIPFLGSVIFHGIIGIISWSHLWSPSTPENLLMNVEIAGAAEMQQAFNDYENSKMSPPVTEETHEPETIQEEQLPENPEKDIEQEQPIPESENIPQETPEITETEKIPEVEPPAPVIEESEPEQIEEEEIEPNPNEEALRLKEEEEKIKQEKERIEAEQKAKKEAEKKKKEAQRKKRELEAIKRIEKKKKDRKNRLAQIAKANKKAEEKKKKDLDFDKMLSKEKKSISSKKASGSRGLVARTGSNIGGHGNGLGKYGDGRGFTESDAAIIDSQVKPHWVVSGGVKNAETLIIRIRIKLKDNGEVIPSSLEIIDMNRYNSDKVFRSAADSAKRAILEASPFKIPPEKMHFFRDFEFSFNTDKALGG